MVRGRRKAAGNWTNVLRQKRGRGKVFLLFLLLLKFSPILGKCPRVYSSIKVKKMLVMIKSFLLYVLPPPSLSSFALPCFCFPSFPLGDNEEINAPYSSLTCPGQRRKRRGGINKRKRKRDEEKFFVTPFPFPHYEISERASEGTFQIFLSLPFPFTTSLKTSPPQKKRKRKKSRWKNWKGQGDAQPTSIQKLLLNRIF